MDSKGVNQMKRYLIGATIVTGTIAAAVSCTTPPDKEESTTTVETKVESPNESKNPEQIPEEKSRAEADSQAKKQNTDESIPSIEKQTNSSNVQPSESLTPKAETYIFMKEQPDLARRLYERSLDNEIQSLTDYTGSAAYEVHANRDKLKLEYSNLTNSRNNLDLLDAEISKYTKELNSLNSTLKQQEEEISKQITRIKDYDHISNLCESSLENILPLPMNLGRLEKLKKSGPCKAKKELFPNFNIAYESGRLNEMRKSKTMTYKNLDGAANARTKYTTAAKELFSTVKSQEKSYETLLVYTDRIDMYRNVNLRRLDAVKLEKQNSDGKTFIKNPDILRFDGQFVLRDDNSKCDLHVIVDSLTRSARTIRICESKETMQEFWVVSGIFDNLENQTNILELTTYSSPCEHSRKKLVIHFSRQIRTFSYQNQTLKVVKSPDLSLEESSALCAGSKMDIPSIHTSDFSDIQKSSIKYCLDAIQSKTKCLQ
jgi:hypothetical protein